MVVVQQAVIALYDCIRGVQADDDCSFIVPRQGKYDKVLLATAKVLKVDENNVKAHYRRAKALMCLGDTVKAAQHLDKAFDVAPDGESKGT